MYKLLKKDNEIFGAYIEKNGVRLSFVFSDPANTDYQEYLEWLAQGNEPLPADQPE